MAAFILGSFLSAIGKASWYREWAMDPHQTDTGNNATLLKKENGKVTIKMEWRHQEADPSFITTVDKFISIIDQWEKLCAEKPSEIVVYKEGDDFILKARNLDDKNMEYTVLQKSDGYYSNVKSSDPPSGILGSFLSAMGRASFYREWAMNPHQTDTGNNATLLEKEDGNVIIQMEWHHKDTDPSFVTTIDRFISIIDQWEKLCAEKPNEIVVYKEGDDFILKARN